LLALTLLALTLLALTFLTLAFLATHSLTFQPLTPQNSHTTVFVTVDPARDSIKQLKLYGKDFHPDIKFVTGTPEMVKKMTKKYRVYVSKADEEDDGDYLVDHSIVLYFGGKKGEFLDFFSQSMKPSDICNKIVEQTEKY